MGDEGRWGLGYVSLAAVLRVAVYLMEAAVSGEWVIEAWHAAMETALLCTSVNHSVTPEKTAEREERQAWFHLFHNFRQTSGSHGFPPVPVITSAAQAAVVTGLTVDAAGLTPGGGGVAVVSSDWFVKVVHDSQVGG